MNRSPLKWVYKALRGLFTNKTSHHPDRDGFLAFNNVENSGTWERIRRGGSDYLNNPFTGTIALTTYQMPVMGMDFNFFNDLTAANNTYLMVAGQGTTTGGKPSVYWATRSSMTVTGTKLTMPTGHGSTTITYGFRPTMVQFKDRLLCCTGYCTTYNSGTVSVSQNSTTVTKSTAWPVTLSEGDRIVLGGQKHLIASVSGSDLYIKDKYTGAALAGSANYRAYSRNMDNFVVFDPNDVRQAAEKGRVQAVGIIPPPTQLTYSTTYYYHTSQADGWVYKGSPDNDTIFTIDSTDPYLLTVTNPDGATSAFSTKVAAGDTVYIYDKEYVIESVTIAAPLEIRLEEAYYDEHIVAAACNPGANTCTLNGVAGQPIPVEIWYGDIGTGDREKYSYNYSYCYHDSHSGHCSSAAPQSAILQAKRPFNIRITSVGTSYIPAKNSDGDVAPYDTIIFLRNLSEGFEFYESGRANAASFSSFIDHLTDDELAPAGALTYPTVGNDPPPEFLAIAEWDGRIWGIQADRQTNLRFSAAEGEVTAGRAEECYDPLNYLDIPTEDGRITGLHRAGDYLYVATDRNLYVVTATYSAGTVAYGFQKIFGGEGVLNQSMCEYAGRLSTAPALFFVTNNRNIYIASPSNGIINVGQPISDALWATSATSFICNSVKLPIAADSTLRYSSLKPRNFIVVSYSGTQHDAFVYDVDLDSWYKHTWAGGASADVHEWMTTSNIFGYPVAVGTMFYTGVGLHLVRYYNDQCYRDLMQYAGGWTSPANVYGTYTANIRTSWLDFDNRHLFKTMNQVRLFTNSSHAFLYDYYLDEGTSKIITNGTFALQAAPWQAGNASGNRELMANIIDSNGSQRVGHCFSIDIKFPNAAVSETIHQLEFLGFVEGREEVET